MEEPAAKFDTLLNHLKGFSRYHTGYPRQEQVSRVLEFRSERQFVELLHQGEPVAVAFTLKCPWTRRFDRVLEDAAAECYPLIKFVRVSGDSRTVWFSVCFFLRQLDNHDFTFTKAVTTMVWIDLYWTKKAKLSSLCSAALLSGMPEVSGVLYCKTTKGLSIC